MSGVAIALRRHYHQRLTQNPLPGPAEVVAWLGAVQAQDYPGAKWALGLRMQDAADDIVERAFSDGAILRTHVMRPTWHFVTPADIRWMLNLTASRVNAASAYMYRQLELDDALFLRGSAVIARALQGGRQLTRVELGGALAEAGIVAEGARLSYIVMRAELDHRVQRPPARQAVHLCASGRTRSEVQGFGARRSLGGAHPTLLQGSWAGHCAGVCLVIRTDSGRCPQRS